MVLTTKSLGGGNTPPSNNKENKTMDKYVVLRSCLINGSAQPVGTVLEIEKSIAIELLYRKQVALADNEVATVDRNMKSENVKKRSKKKG